MKGKSKQERPRNKPVDPWEEIDEIRSAMFLGRWATQKFRILGEDKVKNKLEKLAKKKEEEERKK